MVDEKSIISQCINLANEVIKKGFSAAISIEIGEGFCFKFDNKAIDESFKKYKRKSPSQEARNIVRSRKFNENIKKVEKKDMEVQVPDLIKEEEESETKEGMESRDQPLNESENDELEMKFEDYCEKVFVIPKYKGGNIKEKTNDAIEKEINYKLQDKGIKVRKIFLQRDGNPSYGEYNRSIVLIERFARKLVKDGNFGIENCWVLSDS